MFECIMRSYMDVEHIGDGYGNSVITPRITGLSDNDIHYLL